jgi:ribonuclease P protein component
MPTNSRIYTLPKRRRLATPTDYRRVYNSKHWGNTDCFSFNAKPSENSALGVTVSKKVSNLAVYRNRIKREVKEFYRLHQQQLPHTQIVITAKPACKNTTNKQRRESLEILWAKVQKWRRWYDRVGHSQEQAERPASS